MSHSFKSGYSMLPVDRIRRAMTRISRDRYLSPAETSSIAYSLSLCASRNPSKTADAAVGVCCAVGMIKGRPPVERFDPRYGDVLHAVQKTKGRRGAETEIALLRALVRHS